MQTVPAHIDVDELKKKLLEEVKLRVLQLYSDGIRCLEQQTVFRNKLKTYLFDIT